MGLLEVEWFLNFRQQMTSSDDVFANSAGVCWPHTSFKKNVINCLFKMSKLLNFYDKILHDNILTIVTQKLCHSHKYESNCFLSYAFTELGII